MPIEIAEHAGFCVGVAQAVDRALVVARDAKAQGIFCCSLGDLIHNAAEVKRLSREGLIPVTQVSQAEGAVLVIRSHGVSREVLAQAKAIARQVVDCTCPFVARVHELADSFCASSAPVVLVGDAKHPEMVGTAGWCHGDVHFISMPDQVAQLPDGLDHALVLCQTTFPPPLWEEITKALLARFPGITVRSTICGATRVRQTEALELAKRSDVMIVVGSRDSANTRKLYETCMTACKKTYLVESVLELPAHWGIIKRQRIGVTAGASTPAQILREVIDSMNDMELQDNFHPENEQATPQVQEPEVTPAETAQEPVSPAVEQPAQPKAEAQPSFMDQVAASMARIHNGQTVTGKVVQITDDEVCVNIGYKSDGLIKRSELVDQDVQLGDEIDVEVVKVNDGDGNVILSQRNIVNRKQWDELMQKYEANEFVDAVGKEAVKGGLLASINGVRAFIPASHLSQRYVEKISQFVGQPMKLKIIEVDASKKRVVASRKEVIAAENASKKDTVWQALEEGAIVKGIVRRFASFGAFVDLGGVDGLIHVSDLSWNRSAVPSDILQLNQEVEVKILSLDRERERIQLGYKQLQPKPWDNVEEKYPVGGIITRPVVRIRPFGAFVELEPGVDGLVHISQVSPTRINKVEDVLTPGQEVSVKILAVDPEARRISLSIREALEDIAFDYSMDIPGGEYYHEHEGTAEQGEAGQEYHDALAGDASQAQEMENSGEQPAEELMADQTPDGEAPSHEEAPAQ